MVPMVPKLIWKAFTPALKVFNYSSIPTAQMKTFAMQRQLEAPNSQPEPLDFSLFTFWRTLRALGKAPIDCKCCKSINTTHSQMLGKFEYTRGPIFKVVLEC